jgi:RNA polymerase sigma factor (sigma-70 family)
MAELLHEHGPAVRERMAPRIPRRWQAVLTVEDIMQQTYTDAFLDVGRLAARTAEAFRAWLTVLARCNLVDTIRMLEAERRGGQRRSLQLASYEDSCMALYEFLGAKRTTPSQRVARQEACAAVSQAIEQLPEKHKHVIQLYDLEGEPIEVVAASLGKRAGAVYMIRARAHRQLREILGASSKYLTKV